MQWLMAVNNVIIWGSARFLTDVVEGLWKVARRVYVPVVEDLTGHLQG